MKNSIRKLGLIGAGLCAMTEEKIDALVKDLVDKGDINKEEGKKLVLDMLEESKKQKTDLEKKISEKIQETFSKADVISRKEMQELETRIATLEEEVRKMKNKEKMFFK
ncbi:phasin family protein [Methanosarcina sp. Mfa9]|uniref:phasin family protein n=1 Tax=Methanosarcina sp. Mfa9 TaxID=3439063 RepID=UPI003F82A905